MPGGDSCYAQIAAILHVMPFFDNRARHVVEMNDCGVLAKIPAELCRCRVRVGTWIGSFRLLDSGPALKFRYGYVVQLGVPARRLGQQPADRGD